MNKILSVIMFSLAVFSMFPIVRHVVAGDQLQLTYVHVDDAQLADLNMNGQIWGDELQIEILDLQTVSITMIAGAASFVDITMRLENLGDDDILLDLPEMVFSVTPVEYETYAAHEESFYELPDPTPVEPPILISPYHDITVEENLEVTQSCPGIATVNLLLRFTYARIFETIYIRADGSIDPPTAPIASPDLVTYTLTDNIASISHGIVVERDNIVIDGAGYSLQGTEDYSLIGINLTARTNVAVKNLEINMFGYGIRLSDSANDNNIHQNTITGSIVIAIRLLDSDRNNIFQNTISDNVWMGIVLGSSNHNNIYENDILYNPGGIELSDSNENNIFGNDIRGAGGHGIDIEFSSNNNIYGNNLTNHFAGVVMEGASDNTFYHNNFMNNWEFNADIILSGYVNTWDDGYPSGGNYWGTVIMTGEHYDGVDVKSGPDQSLPGSDGIGDTPYTVDSDDSDDQDCYPLMGFINMFHAGTWDEVSYDVSVASNSTISDFYFDPAEGAFIEFDVAGDPETTGFCRVAIPQDLLWVEDGWTILVDGEPITDYTIMTDETYTYIYFTYTHSTHAVKIIGTHAIGQPPPVAVAIIDINPGTLNLESNGKWVTAYIELPEGYDVNDIKVNTVLLNDTVPAEARPTGVGDDDEDGILDLMVKFDRQALIEYINENIDWSMPERAKPLIFEVTLTVTGLLCDDTPFEGTDAIRVLKFLKGQPESR